MMTITFAVCAFAIWWSYDGYLRFLTAACWLLHRCEPLEGTDHDSPAMTVLVTAYNEAAIIRQRVQNLLDCDYPADRLEILVASDGSTDGTDEIVHNVDDPRVRLFRPGVRKGKTDTQNQALAEITSDIVLFTDAETHFEHQLLRRIVGPLTDPAVGATAGKVLYSCDCPGMAKGQGFYWDYEMKLRRLESRLGILAVVSGACFAVRRELIRPMEAAYGEDCVVPLDVALTGHKVVYVETAVAGDRLESTASGELRSRIRQTLRNWQGTWSRRPLLNPLRHPGYALALWSHKLLRWLSPVFLMGATLSAGWLAWSTMHPVFVAAAAAACGLYAIGLTGWIADRTGRRIPGAAAAYSFLLANLGFLLGVWRAIRGERIQIYRT